MPTTGEQLKQARETRKLTIKQVVQAIHVRAHYLQAMEADDFSAMPSPAQARGFLRMYAEFLGLSADDLITPMRGEPIPEPVPAVPLEVPAPEPKLEEVVIPQPPPPPEPVEPLLDSEPIAEPLPPKPSQTIFEEIGATLRERREIISLTLDEVERHTRIRKHNLSLIESGEFDKLPSPVQLRGTLSAYAGFLDLDTDAILLRYADAIQSRRIEKQENEPQRSAMQRARVSLPFWLRRFVSSDLIFGGSMILIMLALSIWGAGRIFSGGLEGGNSPTRGPSISDVLLANPNTTPTLEEGLPTAVEEEGTALPTLGPDQETPTDTAVPTISSAVQVTVVVLERTYLKVTVDGKVEQDGRTLPGAALTFDGENIIEVLTGSGTAVQIIFNQANLGVMGNYGEVVNRIYTINGVETPTPTPSATPTITPIPSITPRPSATFRPTLTPRPTSTSRPTLTPTP